MEGLAVGVLGARRLVVVMFTDLVSFTASTQANEADSLRRLKELEALTGPIIESFRGRQVKSTGDGALVEFDSALSATECAIEIQRRVWERNSASKDSPVLLRIGLHAGDVVASGSDILGDAVNVAARVVATADPGGICLTGVVYAHIRDKIAVRMEHLAPITAKGLREPLDAYRVALPWAATPTALPEKPTARVAILPLTNISPDPTDEYFADGLTEELISTMSKIRELSVISRTSVMQYKNRSKPISEIGRELGCGTILEGSVRKAGDKIRVTIQAINATEDKHLWSESYDRQLADVFAIQADIASQVSAALKVQLLADELRDISKRPTENPAVVELCIRGRAYLYRPGAQNRRIALKCFEDAIGLDVGCAVAYAGLSECYHRQSHANTLSPEEAYPRMRECAEKALSLDPRLPEAHGALGAVYFHYDWRWQDAEREFRRAIELQPSSEEVYGFLGYLLAVLGRRAESLEFSREAHDLSPHGTGTSRIVGIFGAAAVLTGEAIPQVIPRAEEIVRADPENPNARSTLAWLYFRSSRGPEAEAEMRKAAALSNNEPAVLGDLALLLALSGKTAEATEVLDRLRGFSTSAYVSPVQLACVLYTLGRHDEAFADLEEAFARRAIDLVDVRLTPGLDKLRLEPRWRSIETKMGLPAAL